MQSAVERRRRLAKRAELAIAHQRKLQSLIDQGASCGTCAYFRPAPWMGDGKMHCELAEDGGAYFVVADSHLCTSWEPKP